MMMMIQNITLKTNQNIFKKYIFSQILNFQRSWRVRQTSKVCGAGWLLLLLLLSRLRNVLDRFPLVSLASRWLG